VIDRGTLTPNAATQAVPSRSRLTVIADCPATSRRLPASRRQATRRLRSWRRRPPRRPLVPKARRVRPRVPRVVGEDPSLDGSRPQGTRRARREPTGGWCARGGLAGSRHAQRSSPRRRRANRRAAAVAGAAGWLRDLGTRGGGLLAFEPSARRTTLAGTPVEELLPLRLKAGVCSRPRSAAVPRNVRAGPHGEPSDDAHRSRMKTAQSAERAARAGWAREAARDPAP
jgi:hypothetical protein